MGPQDSPVDQVIARLASRAHGVVTWSELIDAGMTPKQIKGRVAKGALIRVYRGVYRVGHEAPSLEARYLAAVKACGDGALLGGRAAAYLLGLLRGSPPPPEVVTRTNRCVKGVKTRRCRVDRHDATTFRGVPITSVPRTLVDLAAELSLDDLARASHEAEVLRGTKPAHIEAALATAPTLLASGTCV